MISVALCTYNGERYIREQLESILNQTMPVDEIVVCDDGSTDDTLDIIKNYKDKTSTDIRIYLNEENLGPARNFQKAINQCIGDIVFLSDQDDVWMPDKVSIITEYFESNPNINVVFTNALLVDENGLMLQKTLWDYCFQPDIKKMFDRGLQLECFGYGNHATGATMAIKSLKLPNLDYNKEFLHDHALALMAINADGLGYIEKCTIKYRLHSRQACGLSNATDFKWNDFLYPMKEAYSLCTSQNARKRLAYLDIRRRLRYTLWGPIVVLSRWFSYKKLYSKGAGIMMRGDINESIHHTIERLTNKISKNKK